MVQSLSPDLGYRNDWLWLPIKRVPNVQGVKNSLTFFAPDGSKIEAWSVTGNHLVVPREYIPFERWEEQSFQIVDQRTEFPRLEGVEMRNELRGPVQHTSAAIMSDKGSGILSLACGAGKTVVALDRWISVRTPGIVFVHTVDLEEQWHDRILEHTNLRDEDIGVIRGNKWDWEKPICIASIQTLASRIDSENFPEEMKNHFGVGIYDEVHHLGAPEFNKTAPLVKGIRWGLSATPSRRDGLDMLYQYHLGEVLYMNYEQEVIPETLFIRTGIRLDKMDWQRIMDRFGELNVPKLLTLLSEHDGRNERIRTWIDDLIRDDRKIIVLSPRVEHLELLYKDYADVDETLKVGLIHGKHKGEVRAEVLKTCDLIFASLQLAKEGLDRKDLDSMALPFPITDEGMLRQVYGRTQRAVVNKKMPVILVFEDEYITPMHSQCQKMRHLLTNLKYPFDIARGS